MVESIPTTRAEAERILAEREIRPVGLGLQSTQDGSQFGEVIPLSGNDAQDSASVQAKREEIQSIFMSRSGDDPESAAERSLETAQVGPCQRGRIGEVRRRTMTYRSSFGNTSVNARVWYERTSCRQWRIYHVDTTLLSGNREVRVDSHSYPNARPPGGNQFASLIYYWGCRTLLLDRSTAMDASGDWTIHPGLHLGHASYIKSDNPGQNDPDCRLNLGVQITGSAKLNGPRR